MQTIDYKHTIYIGENCSGIFTSDLPIKNGDVPSQTIQLPEGKQQQQKNYRTRPAHGVVLHASAVKQCMVSPFTVQSQLKKSMAALAAIHRGIQ